jgi:hypothetical protein
MGACASRQCEAACFGGDAPAPSCDAPAVAPSGGACVEVTGPYTCNPVTNAGCNEPGSVCDAADGGFTCYSGNNEAPLCAPCGPEVGWCAAGLSCLGPCARYCCDDGDCGSGFCDKSLVDGNIGLCVAAG